MPQSREEQLFASMIETIRLNNATIRRLTEIINHQTVMIEAGADGLIEIGMRSAGSPIGGLASHYLQRVRKAGEKIQTLK